MDLTALTFGVGRAESPAASSILSLIFRGTALVVDATSAMRSAKIPLSADPSRAPFRIYRDIRFSLDKRPYKTNVGAYLSQGGLHDGSGGLYVHIQPERSFMAMAFYQLDRPALERWRRAMAKKPARFQAMLRALRRHRLTMSDEHETLRRMPRGYESMASSPIAKYFRMSSFMVSERLTDEDVSSPRLVGRMVRFAKKAKPLLDFGRTID